MEPRPDPGPDGSKPAPTFRFVHCADLHLGSPFRGLSAVAPEIARVLEQATFDAFDRIVDLAIDRQAAFLVISGDAYDAASRSLRSQVRLRTVLARAAAAGILCFLACGNHDPLNSWQEDLELPEGVHRFPAPGQEPGPSIPVYRSGRLLARVAGVSFPQRDVGANLARELHNDHDDAFSVVVLHASVGEHPDHGRYAPCRLEDLDGSFDYWALGHVHAHQILQEGGHRRPWVVYAGTPQGRSIREAGERGCLLVEVDDQGRAQPEFVPVAPVIWRREAADISQLDGKTALVNRLLEVKEAVREQGAVGQGPVVLRLELTGTTPFHGSLRSPGATEEIAEALRDGERERRDFVWIEKVVAATRSELDLGALRRGDDFAGRYLRTVDALRRQPEEVRRRLVAQPETAGSGALSEILAQLQEGELLELLAAAETLGLERLEV